MNKQIVVCIINIFFTMYMVMELNLKDLNSILYFFLSFIIFPLSALVIMYIIKVIGWNICFSDVYFYLIPTILLFSIFTHLVQYTGWGYVVYVLGIISSLAAIFFGISRSYDHEEREKKLVMKLLVFSLLLIVVKVLLVSYIIDKNLIV
ncbi:MAG: hypothetical protein INQ03_08065 [Candidatus Heimdallarchaeota archaeon]|nr:hypothetical protein [Candidatus Heimdallarchaeota archaeon]